MNYFYKILLITFLSIACIFGTRAQTILTAGDIAIIGFNSDNPDNFALLTLVDIEAGTTIYITDNGVYTTGLFRNNEGIKTWTATINTPKNSIIGLSDFANVSGSFDLSGSGDQIIVYTGSVSTPNFIFALNSEGNAIWQSDCTNANTSALPTGLTNGQTAVALTEVDNAIYNMSVTTCDKATTLAAICNTANWNGDNTNRFEMPSASTPPEPTTDLSIDISVDKAKPSVGEQVQITTTIHNNGTEAATNITATVTIPAGITYASDNAAGNFDSSTGILTINNLAVAANYQLVIIANVTSQNKFQIPAAINSCIPTDNNATNNTANTALNSLPIDVINTPDDYYATAIGLSGDALKQALHDIIDEDTKLTYSEARDALKIIEEDPNNAGKVVLFYTGWLDDVDDFGGNVSQWNREHVWAQSHGDFGTGRGPGTDLHNLRPTDVSVNGARGNLDFDNGGTEYIDGDGATGCLKDGDSWEPRNAVKGDVARVLFYMATRYETEDGFGDFELTENIPSSPNKEELHGKLSVLLQWHKNDPIDEYELRRNNAIFADYQHNRNPFVDHPEFVDYIWGNIQAPQALTITSVMYSNGHLYLYSNREIAKLPDASQFTISYNPTFNPTAVQHGTTADIIDLTLPQNLPTGANVTITYTHTPLKPMATADNAVSTSFSTTINIIENMVLKTASVNGKKIFLTFSEEIGTLPNISQFSASYNPTLSPTGITKAGKQVILTFDNEIPTGVDVTIKYTHKPTSPLSATNGALANSFQITVKSGSTIPAVPISDYSVFLSFLLIILAGAITYRKI